MRLVAISFGLSSIIWIFNSLDKDISIQHTAELKILYDQKTYCLLDTIPDYITSIVEGRGWNVVNLVYFSRLEPITIFFKNPGIKSKIDTVDVKMKLSAKLPGLKVKYIQMNSVEISFDRISSKWVHLKVDESTISLAKGFERDKTIFLEPDSVLLAGPNSLITEIQDTIKVKVPFKGLDKNFNESFKLSYYFNNSHLQMSHEKVNLRFLVRKRLTSYVGN